MPPANTTNCPICSQTTGRKFESRGYWIRECPACIHQFVESPAAPTHVEEIYDDSYFFGGGAGYRDYLDERDILIGIGQRYGELLKKHHPGGSLLDVGTAAGFTLEGFNQSGWSAQGLEPNPKMVQHANDNFTSKCTQGTLEGTMLDEQFDAISMIQVAPHFHDLQKAFHTAAQMTKPGGVWLLELWDTQSKIARLLGQSWHEYNPPSVLHWFSHQSATRLGEQFGMRLIDHGRPRKRLSGSHLKSAMKHNFSTGILHQVANSLTRLVPDSLSLPYPADDVFWVLLQEEV